MEVTADETHVGLASYVRKTSGWAKREEGRV